MNDKRRAIYVGCTTKGAGKSLVISLHEKPTVEKVQISSGAYQDLVGGRVFSVNIGFVFAVLFDYKGY